MKITNWLPIILIGCVGCATAPIIGPFSYMTSQSNKRASIRRSAMLSERLKPEEKAKVVKATMFSTEPNEVAVGVGVDVLALMEGGYTTGEIFKQLGGVLGDAALYTAIGTAVVQISEALDDDDDNDDPRGGVLIQGDGNNVNVTQGDSNVSTSDENESSSGGTSNQDVDS